VFAAAEKSGAAILAMPVAATLKRSKDGHHIVETVDRSQLWEAQTPQVFRRQILLDAYARRGGYAATDDAELVERAGQSVALVPSSPLNHKITNRDDLKLAEQILKILPKPTGTGFAHPFAGDDLWR
jgi:2-C-methyl-D-erythritol 4-phosphate cytidylyltransferase